MLLRLLRRPFFWIIALVIAAFAAAPVIGNDVELRESLLLDALYITLASNLNVMLGYAGYINFGSIVFFGLGGYICVWLVNTYAWSLGLSLVAAGVGVSALALFFGLGILRLRGAFFALSTIGIVEAVQAFAENFTPWGGSSGIYLSPVIFQPLGGAARALWVIYFMMVAVMGLSLYLSYAIKSSKFGLGLLAIGQNEDAAAILGVPTSLYKALAYSASGFLPAIAGGTLRATAPLPSSVGRSPPWPTSAAWSTRRVGAWAWPSPPAPCRPRASPPSTCPATRWRSAGSTARASSTRAPSPWGAARRADRRHPRAARLADRRRPPAHIAAAATPRGSPQLFPGSSWWPPNSRRIAESSRSAKSASPRELKRW